jgi:hypothetical protein
LNPEFLALLLSPAGAQKWNRATFNVGGGAFPLVGQITGRLATLLEWDNRHGLQFHANFWKQIFDL